ncbi:MAG: GNAT family N-acetyltransferase [Haloarculaceae archaeon]
MIESYPDEPAGDFESPPRTLNDDAGRTIEIRASDPGDYEAFVEMYCAFDPADRAQGIPPLREDRIRDWLDTICGGDAIGVVGWHDDDAVGHAILVPDEEGAYELAIFVLQDYQGARIGTKLLESLFGLAQERGVERVWLSVERWNDPAIRLYHNVGFEEVDSESFEVEMTIRL